MEILSKQEVTQFSNSLAFNPNTKKLVAGSVGLRISLWLSSCELSALLGGAKAIYHTNIGDLEVLTQGQIVWKWGEVPQAKEPTQSRRLAEHVAEICFGG